jgi:hypothetical protein
MDATESSAAHAHPPAEDRGDHRDDHAHRAERDHQDQDHDHHHDQAQRPCACIDGWVFVGYIDEHGEEREAAYRCGRCASEAGA